MKFQPNPLFAKEAELLPGVVAAKRAAAEKAKRAARAAAPRRSGNYARSIDVTQRGKQVYLRSNHIFGHGVEFGGGHLPPSAPLRKGALAAGLRVDEKHDQ